MLAVADHDMVVQLRSESFGSGLQLACHLNVVARGRWIARGVIVHSNQSGGIQDQGALHHLTGIDWRMVDRAALLHFVGDQIVFAV